MRRNARWLLRPTKTTETFYADSQLSREQGGKDEATKTVRLVRLGAEDEANTVIGSSADWYHSFTRLNLNAFVITDTELKLIAAAAMIGDSNKPKNGYSTPAATGTPSML